MAPRSAKTKKPVEVKVTEAEVPKKGRGKAKNVVEDELDELETELGNKPVAEKRAKRGKKAANDNEQSNKAEEPAQPAKKGRKKNIPEPEEKSTNGEPSDEDEVLAQAQNEQNVDDEEANGHTDETQSSTGKGKKKPTKKDSSTEKTARSKKNKQDTPETEESLKEEVEDKPKPASKGRGRPKAQPKVQSEPEQKEEVKAKAPTKGRKKAPAKGKAEKQEEKSDESDKEEHEDEEKDLEDKPVEVPKKKEPKGSKNQGKKTPPKEEDIEEEEEEESTSKRRKVMKKDEKDEVKDDELMEEGPATKPAKGRRGQKKAVEASTETDDEPQDTGEPTTKRRRKAADDKAPIEDKKKAPPKNKSATNYEDLDFTNSSKNNQAKDWNFKISSWNVDGIRAWWNKGGLDYIKYEKPDILCLQEVKCSQDKLPEDVVNVPGYHAYWLAGEKDGYAGVGIYTTNLAMNVQYGLKNEELDTEGRIITAEYEQFYLVCTYVPNSGRKLVTLPKRLQWNEEFRKYIIELDKKKPVIICGDMNVSHNEIDLANPKTNRKNAGFTDEERTGMTELLGDGFIDTFRHFYPDKTAAYTFWTYMSNSRAKNVGWRLDYFIVSERLLSSLCDNVIRDQVYGSDHCPISLFLHLTTADKPKE